MNGEGEAVDDLFAPSRRPEAEDVATTASQAHSIAEALWDIAQACRDEESLTCDPVTVVDLEPIFGLLTTTRGSWPTSCTRRR